MDETSFIPLPDAIVLAQWVIGKTSEQIIEMPPRFRDLVSELSEDEDIYGDFVRLQVGDGYLFCHFQRGSQTCTKSIMDLFPKQVDFCRDFLVKNYKLVAEEKWMNTEYEVVVAIVYGSDRKGFIECRNSEGYSTFFLKRWWNLLIR